MAELLHRRTMNGHKLRVSWSDLIVRLTLILSLLTSVLSTPVMKTLPQNVTVNVGDTVILQCAVQDVGSSLIDWYLVDQNTQLSSGNTVLITEYNKYSFVQPIDSSAKQLNLQIKNVQISDNGHYRCYVDGTAASVTHLLSVQGAPEIPNVAIPPADFSECCKSQNMSSTCLPVCTPASVGPDFDPLASCALDLDKLLFCFSDNKNHAGCCRRRMLPDACLQFCLDKPPALGLEHMTCLNQSRTIISCFEEGQVLLPGPPTEVSVLSIPVGMVRVSWHPPTDNPGAVTGYRIHYRLTTMSDRFISSGIISNDTTQHSLIGLQGNKKYEIYVISIGAHGSSLPSSRHFVSIIDEPINHNNTMDIQSCCNGKGVSPWCSVKLCHPSTWIQLNPDALTQCYAQLDDIFHCLAGGRNNTPCCARNNVPEVCHGLCSGQPPPLDWSLTECVLRMPIINACVMQGKNTLPTPPRLLALKKVTFSTAELEWTRPQSGDAASYGIQIRENNDRDRFKDLEEVTTTYIKLTNLNASTEYEVRIITIGNNGSSLPSDSIIFLTNERPENRPPPDTGVAKVHNISACCATKGVPDNCLPACTYDIPQLVMFFADTSNLLSCIFYLRDTLICASDGRDHRSCCSQRFVSDSCLMFCNYTDNSPELGANQILCTQHISDVVQCYEEGITSLPKHPVNVSVVVVTKNNIRLSWARAPTGPPVDHYILEYTPDLLVWTSVNVTGTQTTLQNLESNTRYTVQISAANSDGISPPSNRVTVSTKADVEDPPPMIDGQVVDRRVIWTNRQECCRKHNVSETCVPLCVGQMGNLSLACYGDMGSILACAADGQDHRKCCKAYGVPDSCLSICQGHSSGNNYVTAACIGWSNFITACSAGRADLVPTEPRNFVVNEVSKGQVTVSWAPPVNGCVNANPNCTYNLHYWQVSDRDNYTSIEGPSAKSVTDIRSPHTIYNLKTYTRYRISVTAENRYGGGRHSLSQLIYIEYYGIEDISISQQPEGTLDQGIGVKLFCDVVASSDVSITWRKEGKDVGTGRRLRIDSVKEHDSGEYTCKASSRDEDKTSKLFLPVMFSPKVVENRDDTVEPKKGQTAILACWFSGYPDVSTVKWQENGKTIQASLPKIKVYKEFRDHTGVLAVQLRIYTVVGGDYGQYTCTAANKYGSATCAVRLIDPTDTQQPVITPQPKVTNITACCMTNNVDPDCMVACTYDVDINVIINNPNLFKCANHLPTFAKCAADGSDHSACCKKKDVSDFCLPFCSGNTPVEMDSTDMFSCVNHADSIISCMEENRNHVPNAPLLDAKRKDSSIQVTWDQPTKNGDKVEQYLVYFQPTGYPVEKHVVSSNIQNYFLQNIRAHVRYNIWVIASNDFGQSQKSNVKEIAVSGLPPSAPVDIEVELVTGTMVRLKWSPPRDGSTVSGYIMYYKTDGDTVFRQAHTNTLSFRLSGLDAESSYSAYIVAINADGQSGPSRTVSFTTGFGSPAQQTQSDSATKIGLGIGLTLLFVAIIVVVLMIVYYLKFRRNKGAQGETVSFENPSYGRNQVQISGLPADDMQPTNQFNYGRLNEDNVAKSEIEHPYSSITNEGRVEVNGNNPATLPVTTDEIHISSPNKNESVS